MTTETDDLTNVSKVSPMMLQWQSCKKVAKDALLLFRLGDFYEAFHEDAVTLAKEIDLTLTKRGEIPMAGIPFHTSEAYIDKLIAKGFRVAVAEQTEDPKNTKGLVKREVVRVVTPGTVINSSLISERTNNYFAAITRISSIYGLSYVDLTTGQFFVIEFEDEQDLLNEFFRLKPAECLVSKRFEKNSKELLNKLKLTHHFLLSIEEDWKFEHETAYNFLVNHFQVHSLDGYGLKGMVAAINAAGGMLSYLQETLSLQLDHVQEISTYNLSQFMSLDRMTQRNLELTHALFDATKKSTLLYVLDDTCTPMGARIMHHWIKQPLLSTDEIIKRQDALQAFISNKESIENLKNLLEYVRDIERLTMKILYNHANPRDMIALKTSLQVLPFIKDVLIQLSPFSHLLKKEEACIADLKEVANLIESAVEDNPPLKLADGNVFKKGYNKELDELRSISEDSKTWVALYQTRLREETGIKTLKVGYTRLFGYYIEVSKGQAEKMPDSFIRRQTLVNGERFITPELKEFEQKVLTANERILSIETELFFLLKQEIAKYAKVILVSAQAIAKIDALRSLAAVSLKHGYTRPIVDHSHTLQIIDGKHPVIAANLLQEKFIPNDTMMDGDLERLLLITGPNMAGKSTYIRQVALICIMAQIGCFVPAKSAHIGIIDKVFTRIGASDDLSRGQSTFMVEMTETANILNNATTRSLVILDEIGRGTSTYDGISIAWSVAEYLLTTEGRLAKTLFATHYWELTKLQEKIPGAINYHVAVQEGPEGIIFLRKILQGSTDKSYGIQVAKLAGLPTAVIQRAKEILVHLEENANQKNTFEPSKPKKVIKSKKDEYQLSFFG